MRLDFKLSEKTRMWKALPAPTSVDKLLANYLKAAHITTVPTNVKNLEEDLDRVITLRPRAKNTWYRSSIGIRDGYYAVGRKERDNVLFDIFVPLAATVRDSTNQMIKDHVARLMLRLVEGGYQIIGVNYETFHKKDKTA